MWNWWLFINVCLQVSFEQLFCLQMVASLFPSFSSSTECRKPQSVVRFASLFTWTTFLLTSRGTPLCTPMVLLSEIPNRYYSNSNWSREARDCRADSVDQGGLAVVWLKSFGLVKAVISGTLGTAKSQLSELTNYCLLFHHNDQTRKRTFRFHNMGRSKFLSKPSDF